VLRCFRSEAIEQGWQIPMLQGPEEGFNRVGGVLITGHSRLALTNVDVGCTFGYLGHQSGIFGFDLAQFTQPGVELVNLGAEAE